MGWLDSNGLNKVWENIKAALAKKQDKLTGTAGQVVGFDANGNPVAQSTDSLVGPQGPKGDTGAAAGFGTPTASVDANVGTPSVTVTASGSNTAKVFNFAFKNLKGATGAQGPKGDTGATGAQGPKGDTGAAGAVGAAGAKGDKGDPGLFYGTCSTASSTAAKVVALSGFALTTGAVVVVKFTYANTASSPTLNVNSTGAKYIKKYGTTAPDTYMWQAGAVAEFVYDGTYWIMLNGTTATTTYYGLTKLSSSVSSDSTTLAATPSAVKQAYDLASAALPKSGGTMTGALSVLTPTGDAHAATKAYVDGLIDGIKADMIKAMEKFVCLVMNSSNGDTRINLKLEPVSASKMDYSLTYSGIVPILTNGYLTLEPPPGYAFTGLADTWLPAVKIGSKSYYGALQGNGSIIFSISTANANNNFEFISAGNNKAPARFTLEVA